MIEQKNIESLRDPIEKPSIIVIDDDQEMRNLLEASLRTFDYRLYLCESGAEGVQLAEKIRPSLVICDWMMPGMDGLEVCRKIKSNHDLRLTYFILLTAWGNVDDRVQALETGADDFIAKPPNLKEFRARVRAGLRIHELTRALNKKQKEMEFDLAQARDYIQSILPPKLDFNHPSGMKLLFDYRFIPSATLGGDIFNYQWTDKDHFAFFLLDVSGHGVGSALLSVSVMNLLRTKSVTDDLKRPARILSLMNDTFPMTEQNNLFFTMWYGLIDFNTGELIHACAGHPPAAHMKEHNTSLLKAKGIPVGIVPKFEYSEETVSLGDSGLITVYSDGIYETNSIYNTNERLEGWINIMENLPSATPPYVQNQNMEYLLEKAVEYSEQPRFEDDVSLLQIGYYKT